jgi:hypothetical protein
MRILALILQYGCLAFALYLSYQVGVSIYRHDFVLMDLVANIGTILICIDLGVFLFTSNAKQGLSLEEYARQLEQPPNKWVNISRKLGHLGIMLIICSWIVPLI